MIVGSIPPFADPVEDAQVRTYNEAIPESCGREPTPVRRCRSLACTER